MPQTDATLLRHDRSSHRRGEIVDHNHHINGMFVEETVELSHDLTGNLIQTYGVDTQVILWTRHLEVVEERGFEGRIILRSCIDEQTFCLRNSFYRTNQWRHFHEIRPCTSKDTNLLCHRAFCIILRKDKKNNRNNQK